MKLDINKKIENEKKNLLVCPKCLKKWKILNRELVARIEIEGDVDMPSYDAIDEELAEVAINNLIDTNMFCPTCDSSELLLMDEHAYEIWAILNFKKYKTTKVEVSDGHGRVLIDGSEDVNIGIRQFIDTLPDEILVREIKDTKQAWSTVAVGFHENPDNPIKTDLRFLLNVRLIFLYKNKTNELDSVEIKVNDLGYTRLVKATLLWFSKCIINPNYIKIKPECFTTRTWSDLLKNTTIKDTCTISIQKEPPMKTGFHLVDKILGGENVEYPKETIIKFDDKNVDGGEN